MIVEILIMGLQTNQVTKFYTVQSWMFKIVQQLNLYMYIGNELKTYFEVQNTWRRIKNSLYCKISPIVSKRKSSWLTSQQNQLVIHQTRIQKENGSQTLLQICNHIH